MQVYQTMYDRELGSGRVLSGVIFVLQLGICGTLFNICVSHSILMDFYIGKEFWLTLLNEFKPNGKASHLNRDSNLRRLCKAPIASTRHMHATN